ncbi:hypothetical protein OAS39_01350 [Pirellulales bacterium]|nr:hypothetical protein [Pirellulales bacterium]
MKINRDCAFWVVVACAASIAVAQADEREDSDRPGIVPEGLAVRPIQPMEGTAWVDEEGMRIAWIKFKHCDEAMVKKLLESRVNTLILKSAFHDLMDFEAAEWENGKLKLLPRPEKLKVALRATDLATSHGIHVMWLASYEFNAMKPHLERLGYQHAWVEGPTRFVPAGPHQDAAALDPVFWRSITGVFGDVAATHSLEHAIEGILFDTEHYDGGMMYLHGCGFADLSFEPYLKSRNLGKSLEDLPHGTRYDYLKSHGLLEDFYNYMEEQAYEQGRYLAERWRAVNPHLMAGTWPCFENWFGQGMLRGMGGASRSIGLSGVEYFHGTEQTPAMAEYFESRSRNLKYSPGFYPPYSYTPDQLEEHAAYANQTVGTFWMLSPHGALDRDDYRQALRRAYEKGTVPIASDRPAVNLDYQVIRRPDGPVLAVTTRENSDYYKKRPRLSLRAAFGGSALCEDLPMKKSADGHYRAEIDLTRRLTNNRLLSKPFRSGVNYRYHPIPREMNYSDTHHVKLCDGRAYGYFGTTVAWSNEISEAEVVFDLHRPYRITKVELAQPSKLEDRNGGPTDLIVDLAEKPEAWTTTPPPKSVFPIWSEKDADAPESFVQDKRHQRAWLSREVDSIDSDARWVRVRLQRIRPNSCLSLGQVVIWGVFDGDIQAAVKDGNAKRVVEEGFRFNVPKL